MRHLVGFLACAALATFVTGWTWASEADELRAKAKAVQREAEQLAKEGRKEEAEKHFREAKELLTAASKHDAKSSKSSDRDIDELHERLKAISEKEAHAKEAKNKEALAELQKHREAVERELAEHRKQVKHKPGSKPDGKHPPEPEPMQEVGRRLKHLHAAIDNLNAAGMYDLAEELAKKAEHMQRELHQARERFEDEPPVEKRRLFELPMKKPEPRLKRPELKNKPTPDFPPMVELREELQRLRAEVNELREEIKKRP